MTLTDAEKQEFTLVNLAAYDLHRVKSKQEDSIPPCWLCMSENAKTRVRQELFQTLKKPGMEFTEETLERAMQGVPGAQSKLDAWIEAETLYKQYRAEGNPRAFFAE
jgi:hypothetical protein